MNDSLRPDQLTKRDLKFLQKQARSIPKRPVVQPPRPTILAYNINLLFRYGCPPGWGK